MKISFPIVLALLVALVMGCGGNGEKGSSTGDGNAPEVFMNSLRAAVLTGDIDTIRGRISNTYLDDCENKEELVDTIMNALAVGGTVDFQILAITNKHVGNIDADFTGGFDLKVTNGPNEAQVRRTGTLHLKLENNTTWRLYGDQGCHP